MANGFHGTDERWDAIERPLRRLDSALDEFANRRQLTLTKNARSWPDRSFEWGKRPAILIQVFLESQWERSYTMWVSASDERSRSEYWQQQTLLKAAPIDVLERQLPELLETAYAIAAEWAKTYDASG